MRDWFTKDLSWKLFSVFLALTIWLTVHKIREAPDLSDEMTPGTTLTYGNLPVEIVSAMADVHDYRVVPAALIVKVSGPPKVMAVLQANEIHAIVNLTGILPGRNPKWPVLVSTPPGVTLISVDPPEVGVIIPPKPETQP